MKLTEAGRRFLQTSDFKSVNLHKLTPKALQSLRLALRDKDVKAIKKWGAKYKYAPVYKSTRCGGVHSCGVGWSYHVLAVWEEDQFGNVLEED